jgi:hypothetical protein
VLNNLGKGPAFNFIQPKLLETDTTFSDFFFLCDLKSTRTIYSSAWDFGFWNRNPGSQFPALFICREGPRSELEIRQTSSTELVATQTWFWHRSLQILPMIR